MKFIFLSLLAFSMGYFLPSFESTLQIFLGVGIAVVVLGVLKYYIDVYVNAVRL